MIRSMTFKQTVASTVWTIDHTFTSPPVCDVIANINGQLMKVFPKAVKYMSASILQIEFTLPQSGEARLVGEMPGSGVDGMGSIDHGA